MGVCLFVISVGILLMDRSEIETFIGQELAAARLRKGLTQGEVGRRISRDQSLISKYEAGLRRIDAGDFLRICAFLEVDCRQLIWRIERSEVALKENAHAPC